MLRRLRIIAHHLIHVLYGHWAVNDPRGSGSADFIDLKFAPLGPIHFGRKPGGEQPSPEELRAFHEQHRELLNFPVFWIDDAMRAEIAAAIHDVIDVRGYTCYAGAICANHSHLIIRTHRDDALTMWHHVADGVRERLRLRFSPPRGVISPHHPIISARPYKVFLHSPDEIRGRIAYVQGNPAKEGLRPQHWPFVVPYDNWPYHKRTSPR
jgi:hypothetical protein